MELYVDNPDCDCAGTTADMEADGDTEGDGAKVAIETKIDAMFASVEAP